MKIEDEVERKRIQCYDPEAPITRKGYLICLRTRKSMEIKDTDMANRSDFSYENISLIFLGFSLADADW